MRLSKSKCQKQITYLLLITFSILLKVSSIIHHSNCMNILFEQTGIFLPFSTPCCWWYTPVTSGQDDNFQFIFETIGIKTFKLKHKIQIYYLTVVEKWKKRPAMSGFLEKYSERMDVKCYYFSCLPYFHHKGGYRHLLILVQ